MGSPCCPAGYSVEGVGSASRLEGTQMVRFRDSVEGLEADRPEENEATAGELDALDALESLGSPPEAEGHLVPAAVLAQADEALAGIRSVRDSRLDEGTDYPPEAVKHIMKGDIGEGYTFVRLLERYDRDHLVSQPKGLVDAKGRGIQPDFAVRSLRNPELYQEIVDAKAWSVLYPGNVSGVESPRLANMSHLRETVERYASSPQLVSDGKVVLYFPEEVVRHAPDAVAEIEGWSGSELAHHRAVEVRSMKVWNDQLWKAVWERRKGLQG